MGRLKHPVIPAWQIGLGHSALQSGLVVMPFAIGNVIGASQSDNLTARFGRTVLAVGLGLVAAGITAVWLVLALTTVIGYNGWQLLAPLLIAGVGCGLFIAPNADFIVATVERTEAGAASGVIGTAQRIGSAIGIAVVGTVLFGTVHISTRRADAVAMGFGHSATLAMAVSAALSVSAFALVFALPSTAHSASTAPTALISDVARALRQRRTSPSSSASSTADRGPLVRSHGTRR